MVEKLDPSLLHKKGEKEMETKFKRQKTSWGKNTSREREKHTDERQGQQKTRGPKISRRDWANSPREVEIQEKILTSRRKRTAKGQERGDHKKEGERPNQVSNQL